MKPILFNTSMVKAILDNKKTVTRRIIKTKNEYNFLGFVTCSTEIKHEGCAALGIGSFDNIANATIKEYKKPPYQIGDILYVRETWCDANKDLVKGSDLEVGDCQFIFKVDDNGKKQPLVECEVKNWRPSIHMPRIAARIFLKVTSVKIERLQQMKCEDAEKEGFPTFYEFQELWNKLYKNWDENPWIWVIEFEKL